ncbi:50S ribosomal protein L24 [Neolewinella agarilytica]|jgi:large subunit ribosomal protein L24|uniref:Large ribosomal subunit protein uL24 n=1 Tax=Neolewinella agarilytica TaxID=478744 RepID=A0A1H9C250_9BACT|nr:LSU ribosomal protein L24P [Neolewinella agarilytica]
MANKTYKDKQKRFAPKLKIKKGDMVVVIAGADKDRSTPREVLQILPSENRAIVDGVNIRKKHQKPTETEAGGIVEKAASIHISNLMLVDSDNQPTRVGRKAGDNGKLQRFSKRNGNIIN